MILRQSSENISGWGFLEKYFQRVPVGLKFGIAADPQFPAFFRIVASQGGRGNYNFALKHGQDWKTKTGGVYAR